MSHLLGVPYTVNQMSYDLARLRRKGLIARRTNSNTYDLTPDGQRVAIFYTKVHNRLLTPTNPQPHPNSDMPYASSTTTSPHESTTHA